MNESKKDDAVFIDDILGEIYNIRKFVSGMKKEDFIKNEMAKRAVERSIQIIGEAAKNLSVSFENRLTRIPRASSCLQASLDGCRRQSRGEERFSNLCNELADTAPSGAESPRCKSFREKHSDIEWRKIIAMRNLITHAYSSVDYNMVWEAAMRDCFALEKKLLGIETQKEK